MGYNVIITPFLPVKVFKDYLAQSKSCQGSNFSIIISNKISVIRTGLGKESVCNAIISLKNTNCRAIFFIGSCGGITGTVIGDIILVENAYTGTFHSRQCPDRQLLTAIKDYMKIQHVYFKSGGLYSANSTACEDEKLIKSLYKRGLLGIDLETAAFFNSAVKAGLNALALLYVTDIPYQKPFTGKLVKKDRESISRSRDIVIKTITGFINTKNDK